MRVLHISRSLPPDGKGGQEKCVLKIIEDFQNKFDIIVLVKHGKMQLGHYKIYNYQIKLNIKNLTTFIKKMCYLMKNTDIIHLHYPVPFLPEIPVIPIFLFLNFFLRKKYIVHIHLMTSFTHFLGKFIVKPYKFMDKILFRRSKLILTPTNLTREIINSNYKVPLEKIEHVPYGVSDIFFDINIKKHDKDKIKIIYVGRLHKSKRVDHLIKAILNLPKSYNLEIFGDGDEYERLFRLSNRSEKIKFHGFISNEEELLNAYKNADLMVLPSTSEEMPLSILEALAAGVPVLCSNLPTIRNEYTSHVFYLNDINNLKSKILELTNQDNDKFIEYGRKFASNYRWKNNFKKIMNLYHHFFSNLCKDPKIKHILGNGKKYNIHNT